MKDLQESHMVEKKFSHTTTCGVTMLDTLHVSEPHHNSGICLGWHGNCYGPPPEMSPPGIDFVTKVNMTSNKNKGKAIAGEPCNIQMSHTQMGNKGAGFTAHREKSKF